MEKQGSDSKTGGSNKGVIAIAGVVIIALVGVIIYLVMKPTEVAEEKTTTAVVDTADGRGIVLTPENVDEVLHAEPVPQGYFETAMTNEWTFIDGKSSKDDVYVKNETTNAHTFYFELFIDGENEPIYSSPYVPVGSEMPQFELSKQIEKGDYSATLVYHMVDSDNKEISDVSVAVKLHIK